MKPRSGSRVDSQASDSDAEAALVARVVARDQAAFAELYGLYRRRLARFLGRFLASPQVIDEVINDVMFVVWQDASRFELRSKVSTWIFGIAWHKALKALDRQKREAHRSNPRRPRSRGPTRKRARWKSASGWAARWIACRRTSAWSSS